MPISEDEYDLRNMQQEPQTTMSKAELRKTHKPIMEKRRRARINHCLNEIKTLILEAMNKDPARHSKLEKADILEMAVKHLQNVQRQQLAMAMASDPAVLRKFKNGFNECAGEIDRYISEIDGVESQVKQNINSHLQKCINGIEQVAHFNFPGFNNAPYLTTTPSIFSSSNQTATSINIGDQNNNPRIQIPQGLQLIPSRLPTGELALLVPNSSNMPYFPNLNNNNNNNQIERASAFNAVIPSATQSDKISPPVSPHNSSGEDLQNQFVNSPSPRGFRPVQPTLKIRSNLSSDHQVPQITSTQELVDVVKTIKFPIHNHAYQQERKFLSPKKVIEPLCIITNQNERYKQAQIRSDSMNYEENLPQVGVAISNNKRKYCEQSLLTTITNHEFSAPLPKVSRLSYTSTNFRSQEVPDAANEGLIDLTKSYDDVSSPQSRPAEQQYVIDLASHSRDGGDDGPSGEGPSENMWRPW